MRIINLTIVILSTFVYYVHCANILAMIPMNSPSHFIMFDRLFKGLVAKGHDLDVFSHFPQKKPIPRYNDFSIAGNVKMFKNNLSIDVVANMKYHELLIFMLEDCGYNTCVKAFESPLLHELKNTEKKYDLLLTELFGSDCMYGFAHHFKIPVVTVTTSVNLPWGGDRIGNPDNPSYIPTYVTTATSKMSLFQRMDNIFRLITSKFGYHWLSTNPTNKLCKEFFGPDLPDMEDLVRNTSLLLINSHFSINQPRPTVPNFIEVGGLHIGTPKTPPQHIEDIIKKNPNGFIYLTMGSMVMTESFSIDKIQGMFDAFSELPYTVLWKAKKERFPEGLKFPSNIHFEPWMPQLDLLCHPKIKLFVSHGGLLGSQEAVHCGVPRIGIPIFADQELNIYQSEEMGIAIKVDYNNISKTSILEAASRLLQDDRYRVNSKKLSEIFKDRQNQPLDTAIYWIEYVIKYRGAPHLRSSGADLPWYQYYLIDIGLIFLSILVGLMYVLTVCCRTIFRINVNCNKTKKLKKN